MNNWVIHEGDALATGVVCRRHSRRFVGIEINSEYAAIARGRLGEDVTTRGDDALPLFHQLEAPVDGD